VNATLLGLATSAPGAGVAVGAAVGFVDGAPVGDVVGVAVGFVDGALVGDVVGFVDGVPVGDVVDVAVGTGSGPAPLDDPPPPPQATHVTARTPRDPNKTGNFNFASCAAASIVRLRAHVASRITVQ